MSALRCLPMSDIFDLITADTPEGREFADALREETERVEIVGWEDSDAGE